MPNFERLSNPPIKEAILWIRTNSVAEKNVKISDLVPKQIDKEYPGRRQQVTLKATIGPLQQDQAQPTKTEHAMLGELRDSADGTRTVSVRRDGIAYSALKGKYEDWGNFIGEFERIWKLYLSHNSPSQITRVSTRFINAIHVPLTVGTPLVLEDWFKNPPKVPAGLPDILKRFTLQIEVPSENDYLTLLNLVSIGASQDEGAWTVLLDIDVSRSLEIDAKGDGAWPYYDELRRLKNIAFFGTLTERALELYR